MDKNEILRKLKSFGLDTDDLPKPGGSYIAVNVRGNIAYVAIQFPILDGKFFYLGRLGKEVSTAQGYQAARMASLNVMGQIARFVGFERPVALNHIDILYQSDENWDDAPAVANGASDLFIEVLGENGRHTRSISGVHKLVKNHSVAIVASFTVEP